MLSMEAALRKDNVQPDPKGLGPIYRQNFLTYLKKNPHMNITAFGLNCAAPEDLIASLHGMFDKKTQVIEIYIQGAPNNLNELYFFCLGRLGRFGQY